jgi:uridine kinase
MTLDAVADAVAERERTAVRRVPLVAVSGIDGSGKSTIAPALGAALTERGLHAAVITADPWHTPAPIRFNAKDPARHFYRYAFRWTELFERVIDPLRRHRSLTLSLPLLRLSDDSWHEHLYDFHDVDVVILEGIFVLRRIFRRRYNVAVWIHCSFETALRRALARNQEDRDVAQLRHDYSTVYFPAQQLHLRRDQPHAAADFILGNDVDTVSSPPSISRTSAGALRRR